MNYRERILGCLYGAALGDAIGANTETKKQEQIKEQFNGYYFDLAEFKDDVFMYGFPAGYVTDDFSLGYYTCIAILDHEGDIDESVANNALLNWSNDDRYNSFAGPSTKTCIAKLKGEEVFDPYPKLACNNSSATNGSGMKIFPAGLVCAGDLDQAVKNAVIICTPSHFNQGSISGGAAIACSVSKAMTGASLEEVIEAGFYGAREGYKYGKPVSVAKVENRMKLAIDIANKGMSFDDTMKELAETVGAGLNANEAIPCVYGILAYTKGDPIKGLKMAVNIGNDTDTVATMLGAIVGAMNGSEVFPKDFVKKVEEVNKMDLSDLADRFVERYYNGK